MIVISVWDCRETHDIVYRKTKLWGMVFKFKILVRLYMTYYRLNLDGRTSAIHLSKS